MLRGFRSCSRGVVGSAVAFRTLSSSSVLFKKIDATPFTKDNGGLKSKKIFKKVVMKKKKVASPATSPAQKAVVKSPVKSPVKAPVAKAAAAPAKKGAQKSKREPEPEPEVEEDEDDEDERIPAVFEKAKKKLEEDKKGLQEQEQQLQEEKKELQEEKKGLQEKEKKLWELVSVVSEARTPLTDNIKRQLRAVAIVDHDNLDDVLLELGQRLKLVQESLTSVEGRLTSVERRLANYDTRIETAQKELDTARKQGAEVSLDDLDLKKKQVARSSVKEFSAFEFEFQSEGWKDSDAVWKSFKSCIEGETDKQRRSVLVVASGMGDGKSRLLQELVGLLSKWWSDETVPAGLTDCKFTDEEKKDKFNVVELRVNFENSTSLRDDEREAMAKTKPKERAGAIDKILLDRLLYPMLSREETTTFEKFRKRKKWNFTCDDLLTCVQKLFEEKGKKVLVVLLIDGIHNLDDYECAPHVKHNYKDSKQRELLHKISDLIKSSRYRFVACSSTMPLTVERALGESRQCRKVMVSPPVLTKLPTEIENEVVAQYAPQFLTMFGSHPRSMELLLRCSGTSPQEVFLSAVRGLKDRYEIEGLSNGELTAVLKLCFSRRATLESSLGKPGKGILADVMRSGVMRILEGRLDVSPLYLMALQQKARDTGNKDSPLHGWEAFKHQDEQAFEKYVAWVRCLRSRVFTGDVALKELHYGMEWLSGVPEITVQSKPFELHEAEHQIETASKEKACKQGGGETGQWQVAVKWKDDPVDPLSSCIVNGKSAQAGDVFCSVKTGKKTKARPAPVRFNEVYQAKSWGGNKRKQLLPEEEVTKNAAASASKGDVYVLVTRKKVGQNALEKLEKVVPEGVHVGVVCDKNFNTYFGPFAGTFLHSRSAQ